MSKDDQTRPPVGPARDPEETKLRQVFTEEPGGVGPLLVTSAAAILAGLLAALGVHALLAL